MHFYQSNTKTRRTVAFIFAILSIPLAWGLSVLLRKLNLNHLWMLDAPAVWGFYGLLYWAFVRHGWRFKLFHTLGLVEVPNFSGKWSGSIKSSHDGYRQDCPVSVMIHQDYERIQIRLNAQSESLSKAASIHKDETTPGRLRYLFENIPDNTAAGTMEIHQGTCELELSGCGNILEGGYYSGRGRKNDGTIRLTRT